jgi:hypothetical protein
MTAGECKELCVATRGRLGGGGGGRVALMCAISLLDVSTYAGLTVAPLRPLSLLHVFVNTL